MFKVKISSIGRSKEPWLKAALAEYEKRLSRQMEIEWIFAKDDAELIEKITTPWIALDVQGEQMDSLGFAKKINHLFCTHGSRLHFLIGGANGISKKILEQSIWTWSLSKLTFTHQMTRLILLEQLYRAMQIDAGTAYHK
jgi:23S rRNA (pseudouridine1915-N3)-methyltransferase